MASFDRIDQVAGILASAPAWARQALTSSDPRERFARAETVSAFLLKRIEAPAALENDDQLILPIAL